MAVQKTEKAIETPKEQPKQQLQQSTKEIQGKTNTLNIDGELIPVGDMMVSGDLDQELTQVDATYVSDDMQDYTNLQQGDNIDFNEDSYIMTNQQKLEQIMSQ